jgi:hypothetical protein
MRKIRTISPHRHSADFIGAHAQQRLPVIPSYTYLAMLGREAAVDFGEDLSLSLGNQELGELVAIRLPQESMLP